MAGDWIPFAHETLKKPEVYGIANRLDISRPEALGLLLELWVWGDENAIDGHARSVTKTNIDRDIGVTGFADAVEAEGWLEVQNGGIFFPHWERHMGKSAKSRLLGAHRQREHRSRNADVTPMSRSERDKNVTTEQKRTEEKDSSEPKSPAPEQKVSWSLTGGWLNITDADRADWKVAYPACDINRQLAAMTDWLKANPAKAHKKQWRRFIGNWLSRSQERGGDVKSEPAKPSCQGGLSSGEPLEDAMRRIREKEGRHE